MSDTSPPSSARPAQRDLRLDALRMLACAMVVLMHSSAQNWYILPPRPPTGSPCTSGTR